MVDEFDAFCRTGKNAGKPGPCPEDKGGDIGKGAVPRGNPTAGERSAAVSHAVDALPDAPGHPKGVAQVPFPHTRDSPYVGVWLEHAHTDREPEMVVGDKRYPVPKAVIPIDSLVATQDFVLRSTLKDLADAPPGKLKPPLVLKKDGKLYLDEGTHRATLTKLRGQKNILVHLFDADSLDAPDATFADPYDAFCQTGKNAGKPGPCPEDRADANAVPDTKAPTAETLRGSALSGAGNVTGNQQMIVAEKGGKRYVLKQYQRADGPTVESKVSLLAGSVGLPAVPVAPAEKPNLDAAASGGWKGHDFGGGWGAMPFAGRPLTDEEQDAHAPAVANDALFGYAVGNNDRNPGNLILGPDGVVRSIDFEPSFGTDTALHGSDKGPGYLDGLSDAVLDAPLDRRMIRELVKKEKYVAEVLASQHPADGNSPAHVAASVRAASARMVRVKALAGLKNPTLRGLEAGAADTFADPYDAFCQTGKNAGKPGPCPEEGGQENPRPRVTIALARERIAEGKNPLPLASPPWPWSPDWSPGEIDQQQRKNLPWKFVPIEDMLVTQHAGVQPDKVASLMSGRRHDPDQDSSPPFAVKAADGKYYLVDGHHRVAADIAKGAQVVKVKVVRLKKDGTPVLPRPKGPDVFADFPSPDGWDEFAAWTEFSGEKRTPSGRTIRYQGGKRV